MIPFIIEKIMQYGHERYCISKLNKSAIQKVLRSVKLSTAKHLFETRMSHSWLKEICESQIVPKSHHLHFWYLYSIPAF